jgi:hypothetical protein
MSRRHKILAAIVAAFICFACIAVGICVSTFIEAKQVSNDSIILSEAVDEASSIADTLIKTDGNLQSTAQLLRDHSAYNIKENKLTLYYDSDFDPTTLSNIKYRGDVTVTEENGYNQYSIVITEVKDSSSKVVGTSLTDSSSSGSSSSGSGESDGQVYSLSFKYVSSGGGQ